MPTSKLQITIRNSQQQIDKLIAFRSESEALEAKYQHFIAEMIMLRLFSVFEDSVAEMAFKLASGAIYQNGLSPVLSTRAKSMTGARGLFLTHGRGKPVQNLKWTRSKYICESVQHVICSSDPFIKSARRNGSLIEEMRKVRNALAHNTKSARTDYRSIIRLTYGANVSLTPGAFLSATKRTPVCNLSKYLLSTKIILNDMASGV